MSYTCGSYELWAPTPAEANAATSQSVPVQAKIRSGRLGSAAVAEQKWQFKLLTGEGSP